MDYVYIVCTIALMSGALAEHSSSGLAQNDYKMEFERADAIRHNERSMKVFEVRTFKYNRTCTAVNVTFEASVDAGNDLEVITQGYAFLSNEYRLFPMRFEVNFCESMAKNYVGFAGFGKCGTFNGCPIRKGKRYHFCNFVPDQTQLPPLIPDGRYMVELQGVYKGEEAFVVRAYGRVYRPIPILGK